MDPTTEAMGIDAVTAALTTTLFEVVARLSKKAKGPWKRRLKMVREFIPWLAPVLVAGVRGGWTASQGGDSLEAVMRGFAAGAFAVWLRTSMAAPRKVAEAGAPDDGDGR